ncbi:NCS2 family permease [Oscillibacter sp.]|uniref:NCS2 family permease n=1 Tax=Oscillibacter sp. TaxID=1945593 RepID=UPI0026173A5D|nr:NCS2 family permease [Oscillibacter sp.]MDD3346069.1 NCS2 family permease [Oscillibacter sp.]
MEQFFKLKEHGTTVRTEIMAGFTTFMAMAYILMVNAGMFSALEGQVTYNAIYIATAISAVIGTVLIGLLSNLPLAQASGMGLNAYFVYTVCFGIGLTYANALVLVLTDGIIFILLTVTGLRKKIFDAIPAAVRMAIPAGIGLFIAFLGLQNAGLIVDNGATLVSLASFNVYSGGVTWSTIMPMLVTFFALLSIAAMSRRGVKGSVLFGILGGAVAYYVLGLTVPGFYDGFAESLSFNPFTAFGEFAELSFGKVFTEGFQFAPYIEAHGMGGFLIMFITTALAFCMVDMFDTLGTLYGACARGGLLTKEGEVPQMDRAMLADAIATTTGAVCGTSTVTTFVESSAGVGEGGRTGLASMSTAVFFFIAMFLSPVAQLIPSCATAAALIYVGVLMMNCVRDIEWTAADVAVPAFLTVAMMPFTYSISFGIAFGLIAYAFIAVFTGKAREIKPTTWVIVALFAMTFFLTH